MASQAQIQANRRNSQKSTGPRSVAGKAASSQNATRSGLYAASLLIDGDDPEELEALAREYLDSCHPVGPRETAAVDSLFHSDWLLRRMRRVETQMWNSRFDDLRESRGDEFDETDGLYVVYAHIEDRIDRIQRRITTLERLYHRRLAELERLQSQRPPAPDPDPPAPPSPEIGFVSSIPLPAPLPGPEPAVPVARAAARLPGIGFVSSIPPAAPLPAAAPVREAAVPQARRMPDRRASM